MGTLGKSHAFGSDVWSLGPSQSSPDLGINVSRVATLLPAETAVGFMWGVEEPCPEAHSPETWCTLSAGDLRDPLPSLCAQLGTASLKAGWNQFRSSSDAFDHIGSFPLVSLHYFQTLTPKYLEKPLVWVTTDWIGVRCVSFCYVLCPLVAKGRFQGPCTSLSNHCAGPPGPPNLIWASFWSLWS